MQASSGMDRRIALAGMVVAGLASSSGARADSVYDPATDTETYYSPFELVVLKTCDGRETDGHVWTERTPRRHFAFYGDTPQGRTFVLDDVIFRSSIGSSCTANGSVIED